MTVDQHAQNQADYAASDTRTELQRVTDKIFFADDAAEPVSVEEEQELVRRSNLGDQAAMVHLLRLYAPKLRKIRAKYRDAPSLLEETVQCIVGGFCVAIALSPDSGFDRVEALAERCIRKEIRGFRDTLQFSASVPDRTRSRVMALNQAAEERGVDPESIASEFDLSINAYRAATAGVNPAPLDHDTIGVDWQSDLEDYDQAHRALDHLDELPRDICRWYYGFNSPDPLLSDSETARQISIAALGEDAVSAGQSMIYRSKVQRLRTAALQEMREFLSDDEESDAA